MAPSKRDREEYEEGRRDRDKGVFEQALIDIPVNHPDSEAITRVGAESSSTKTRTRSEAVACVA